MYLNFYEVDHNKWKNTNQRLNVDMHRNPRISYTELSLFSLFRNLFATVPFVRFVRAHGLVAHVG